MKQIKFNDFTKEYLESQNGLNKIFKNVLSSGWYILGKEVLNFEQEFANYLGAKFCIGVGNGLEALQISLMALGIKEGDEVITTPVSAAATALAILALGAKPIFIDIDSKGQMNSNLISNNITSRTKAILPVDLYGQPLDLDKFKKIAKKFHLHLIEDACQAHGSSYRGRKVGSNADISCFSFYPTKNLGAIGDGGAIITNNKRLAQICYEIRDYGQKKRYNHIRYGLNSRLDELQAAILRFKLKKLDHNNMIRRKLAKLYFKSLSKIKEIEIITDNMDESNFHLYVIRVKNRSRLKKFLESNSIPFGIHYPRILPKQKFINKFIKSYPLPNAYNFVREIISLPIHPQMTPDQVQYISSKISIFFQNEI